MSSLRLICFFSDVSVLSKTKQLHSFTMNVAILALNCVSLYFLLFLSSFAIDLYTLETKNNSRFKALPILTVFYCQAVCFGWAGFVYNYRRWYIRSIKRFYWHRILMPAAAVCMNVLFPLTMVLNFYGSWVHVSVSSLKFCSIINSKPTQIPMTITIYGLITYLAVAAAERILESEPDMKFEFPKAGQLNNLQVISILVFSIVSQTYYVYLCFMDYYPFCEEYIAIMFWSRTLFFCPLLNILTLPMIHLGFYVYNSDTILFSRVHPETGLKWRGIKRWNVKSRKWEIDESPEQHAVLDL